jgi:superfamily I DNA/RNA helicase
MEFSPYQEAFFKKIEESRSQRVRAVLRAVPGSGKTTTLIEGSKRSQAEHKIFLAYSKSVVEDLKKKLPKNVEVRTVHSLGNSTLWKYLGKQSLEVDNKKYEKICREIIFKLTQSGKIEQDKSEYGNNGKIIRELENLTRYTRVTLADFRDAEMIKRMIGHFGLEIPNRDVLIPELPKVLEEGMRIAKEKRIIDNTDQIWLPSKRAWDLEIKQFQGIFVDEAQDLSEATIGLIEKISKEASLICFAGDQKQSIMAFSGARSNSLKEIVKRFQATEMLLPICYRSSRAVIEEAKKFAPEMQAAPGAIEGKVEDILMQDVADIATSGDFITCRTITPLVKLCLQLISKGKRAVVVGENVEKFLIEIIQDLEKTKGFKIEKFSHHLETYKRQKMASLFKQKLSNRVIDEYKDKLEAARECCNRLINDGAKTSGQLKEKIKALFSDREAEIKLFTIHKIKGLEAQRVIILGYDKLPLTWEGQKEWEEEQEENAEFVAISRAKEVLIRAKDKIAV